ncbi:E3 ubiquitin-protein ligase RNF130-like isoform X1 [Mya arenaria]|uniref:E3 ubiquitin-protein ligase RNF130-like isoform X1 n=1 Tax=Mya arenaria TaxID=6604 RepID=UPI0022E01D4B|nr:E3 ubiquitin-protein ligase RNF130-like isoform X1 [Mya arenaria]
MDRFTNMRIVGYIQGHNSMFYMHLVLIMVSLFIFTSPVICDSTEEHEIRSLKITIEYIDNAVNGLKVIHEKGRYSVPLKNKKYQTPAMEVKGQLVYVETEAGKGEERHEGCGPLDPNVVPSQAWIALVVRGNCTFNEKVYYSAKSSNASAVIIYMKSDTIEPAPTTAGDKNSHDVHDVVAIYVGLTLGNRLQELLLKYGKVNVTLTPEAKDPKESQNPSQLSNTSVLFVSISFIVLIIISLAWLVFYYIQRCRYTNAKERLSRRLANAAKKAIAKIPQRSVKIGDKELDSDADQCAVCIEPYKVCDVIRVLPCKHVFHKSCVDPWLLDQRSCPMCKMDILRAFGMHLNDSQESVPQDVESGLMSSTPAADDMEPLSQGDEEGAVGGVKIVLYQHPVRYDCEPGVSSRYIASEFSSDSGSQSSPVAQCHVECTSQVIVEKTNDSDTHLSICDPVGTLQRSGSDDSLNLSEDDFDTQESHSLITGLPPSKTQTVSGNSSDGGSV